MSSFAQQGGLFLELFHKPLQIFFFQQALSRDGGLLLRKARDVEEALSVVREIAEPQNETTAFDFPREDPAGSWSHTRRVLANGEVGGAPDQALPDNLPYGVTADPGTPQQGLGGGPQPFGRGEHAQGSQGGRGLGMLRGVQGADPSAASTLVPGQAPTNRDGGERPQVSTLRMWLTEGAVRVRESARRLGVDVAETYPWASRFRQTALRWGGSRCRADRSPKFSCGILCSTTPRDGVCPFAVESRLSPLKKWPVRLFPGPHIPRPTTSTRSCMNNPG